MLKHNPARTRVNVDPAPPRIPGELVAIDLGRDDLVDEPSFTDVSISGAQLAGTTAHGLAFAQTRLAKVNLSESRLRRFEVSDVIFADCNLANMRVDDGSFRRVVFTQNKMTGLHLIAGTLANVTVTESLLDFSRFDSMKCKDVRFERCHMHDADFTNCTFEGVTFSGCDMTRATFERMKISGSYLRRCTLTGMRGVASLRGIAMEQTDLLEHAELFAAELGIIVE